MRALIVVAVTWLVAAGLGRTLMILIFKRLERLPRIFSPLENLVFSSALGLGVIAYGVFAIGMAGLLSPVIIGVWLSAVALAGAPGVLAMWAEFRSQMNRSRDRSKTDGVSPAERTAIVLLAGTLITLAVIAAAARLHPPDAHAWDAIAYHLADPKIYLSQHRISILPTQHHSNFPFTMEMLFTIGLAFDGYAAANLFHLLTAVILVLGIICFCNRFLSRLAGLIAAFILGTTPIVLWEATVAYIDLGLALYQFLAAYLVIMAARVEQLYPELDDDAIRGIRWRAISLAGVMLGFALGIKYLALLPLVFLVILALLRRLPLRMAATFALIACVVGSPWYIKNVVWMHNPVYPFAFNVFRGSRYWSDDRAGPYADEQKSFGTAHEIGRPLKSLRNLAATPWKLAANPEIYTNRADFTFTSLIGGLYAGFILSIFFLRGPPKAVRDLVFIFASMFVCWFFVSQHVRYLIPALPFAAILCGYAAERWMRGAVISRQDNVSDSRLKLVNMIGGFIAGGALVGQAIVLGWGITALPTGGHDAELALGAGLEPTALSVPEVVAEIQQPGERERHLRRLPSYAAAEWINQHTPEGAGVVIYEDVHGFYLDRPYLWGNEGHSSYIPYGAFRSGTDLTRWFRSHGIQYALFNLNGTPSNPHTELLPDDPASITASMKEWYESEKVEPWRRLIGEAVGSGQWVVRYTHHGVAVLEIGAAGN